MPLHDALASPPNDSPCDEPALIDPPPPYPSHSRRGTRTARSIRAQRIQTSQLSSNDSHSDHETTSPQVYLIHGPFSDDHDNSAGGDAATETTPFLSSSTSPRIIAARRLTGRPRSFSHTSTVSVAPSLAQTVFSLFRTEDESDFGDVVVDGSTGRLLLSLDENDSGGLSDISPRHRDSGGFFSLGAWGRYFSPLGHGVYYQSLFHLMVVNFPYALAAWVYLFIFTVVRLSLLSLTGLVFIIYQRRERHC